MGGLFGKIVKGVLTGGASVILEDQKDSRAKLARQGLDEATKNLIVGYRFTKTAAATVSEFGTTSSRAFAIQQARGLVDGFYVLQGDVKYPSYGAYVWAGMQRAVVFDGLTPSAAETKYGNVMKYEAVKLDGKFDWALVSKQALLGVAALATSLVTGGLGAPAAFVGLYSGATKLQKDAGLIKTNDVLKEVVKAPVLEPKALLGSAITVTKEDQPFLVIIVIALGLYFLLKGKGR